MENQQHVQRIEQEDLYIVNNKSQLNGPLLYEHNMIAPQSWNRFLLLYIVLYLQVLQCLFHIFNFSISSLFSLYVLVLSCFCIFRVYLTSILCVFFHNSQFFTYIFVYFGFSISFIFSGFIIFSIFSSFLKFLYFYAFHRSNFPNLFL